MVGSGAHRSLVRLRPLGPLPWWLYPDAAHVDLYEFAKQDYERRLMEFIAARDATAPSL